MHIGTKTKETNTKNKSFKKLDAVVIEKQLNVFIRFQVFYILLCTYSLDQANNVLKCDQITALNKNAGDFITLCLFTTIMF